MPSMNIVSPVKSEFPSIEPIQRVIPSQLPTINVTLTQISDSPSLTPTTDIMPMSPDFSKQTTFPSSISVTTTTQQPSFLPSTGTVEPFAPNENEIQSPTRTPSYLSNDDNINDDNSQPFPRVVFPLYPMRPRATRVPYMKPFQTAEEPSLELLESDAPTPFQLNNTPSLTWQYVVFPSIRLYFRGEISNRMELTDACESYLNQYLLLYMSQNGLVRFQMGSRHRTMSNPTYIQYTGTMTFHSSSLPSMTAITDLMMEALDDIDRFQQELNLIPDNDLTLLYATMEVPPKQIRFSSNGNLPSLSPEARSERKRQRHRRKKFYTT
jgi:hypothetical protein